MGGTLADVSTQALGNTPEEPAAAAKATAGPATATAREEAEAHEAEPAGARRAAAATAEAGRVSPRMGDRIKMDDP